MNLFKGLNSVFHIKECIHFIYGVRYIAKYKDQKNKKKIFFMMVPSYGNLGDQAIAVATLKFLDMYYKDYKIIEVNLNDTYLLAAAIKRVITKEDIIVLQGGGNMGNLWLYIEDYRRFIIRTFKNYHIISMPVTATFSDDIFGKIELYRSKRIYKKSKNFLIAAREMKSYNFIKKEFPYIKVILCPDIVLYLKGKININSGIRRQGSLLCYRHDLESINISKLDRFIKTYQSPDGVVFIYDTSVARNIQSEVREIELQASLNQISASRVLLTDRMHGMIFSYLTNTPCVVTKALDNKIPGTFQWIKGCGFINLIDELSNEKVQVAVKHVLNTKKYDAVELDEYFNKLRSFFDQSYDDRQ